MAQVRKVATEIAYSILLGSLLACGCVLGSVSPLPLHLCLARGPFWAPVARADRPTGN